MTQEDRAKLKQYIDAAKAAGILIQGALLVPEEVLSALLKDADELEMIG